MLKKIVKIKLARSTEEKSTYTLFENDKILRSVEASNEFIDNIINQFSAELEADKPDAVVCDVTGVGSYVFETLSKSGKKVMTEEDYKKSLEAIQNKSLYYSEDKQKERLTEVKKGLGHELIKKTVIAEEIVTKDLEEGEIEAVIASDSLDRHGDILSIEGLDITKFKKNPVVPWSHNYEEFPVAQALSVRKTDDGKVVAKMKFAIAEYDKARTAYLLYKGGYLRAFSIGFIALEIDDTDFPTWVYTKSEMLEFSAVTIPANPDALMIEGKGMKDKDVAPKKAIDTDKNDTYNKTNMLTLKDILAKNKEDLTLKEISYLKEHASELSTEQKSAYSDLLEEKDVMGAIKSLSETVQNIGKKVQEMDKPVVKDIAGQHGADENEFVNFKSADDLEKKAQIFKQWMVGLYSKDFSGYKAIRKQLGVIGKSAMNTGDAGQSPLIPPTEFVTEVNRLEEEYGVAEQFANVRRTDKTSVTVILGDDDVEVFDTAEAGEKKSTKLSYTAQELTFRKFAAILPSTDELLEDSAIDLWADATQRFARAYSKKADEMVFTRANGGGNLYPGIIHAAGVAYIDVGDDLSDDLTADHLNQAIYAVPTPSAERGRFYMHRTVLGVVQRLKDENGAYIWNNGVNGGAGPTIWNKPYTVTEVLPGLDQDGDNKAFIVFGDLKKVTLAIKNQMKVEIFNTGIVTDPDDENTDLNLLTQDLSAMRVVKRMNSRVTMPAAFAVIGTSPSLS